MKKLTLLSILALIVWQTNGQGIWYMTSRGGYENVGTINSPSSRIDLFGTGFQSRWGLTLAPNGKMYGVAQKGGPNDGGTLYSFDPSTGKITKHYEFLFEGRSPSGKLVLATNGKLYGTTTYFPGAGGTIFQYDPATDEFFNSFIFETATGFNPSELMQASNGKLYGTLNKQNGKTALFEFDPIFGSFNTKVEFTTAGESQLMQASNGKIYVVSSGGGVNGVGALFEYDFTGNTIIKKHDFSNSTGESPSGKLLEVSGKFYGVCVGGGTQYAGTIYEFNPSTGVVINKLSMASGSAENIAFPIGSLTKGSDGKIYGHATYAQGPPMYLLTSAVFSFDIATSTVTPAYFPPDPDSQPRPMGQMIEEEGSLYGVTDYTNEVFRFNMTTREISTAGSLKNGENGGMPYGGLLLATNSKIYGMTRIGGAHGKGVLFEFDRGTNKLTPKVSFNGVNGAYPEGSLMQASNGKLYGMTPAGGEENSGVIFEYDTKEGELTVKRSFNAEVGTTPYGDLIEVNSKLYGVTSRGGANGKGTLFSYEPENDLLSSLEYFSDVHGSYPEGSLMVASDGKLYGVTSEGGANGVGTLFQYVIGSQFSVKADFTNALGINPKSTLVEGLSGFLFGTCYGGGANARGTIFKYEIESEQIAAVANFSLMTTGYGPMGTMLLTPNGELHGTTTSWGANGTGTYFTYNLSNGNFNATPFSSSTGPAFAKRSKLLYTKTYQTILLEANAEKTIGDPSYFLPEKTTGNRSATYSSSDPTIASIENGNKVVIHKIGTVTITGTAGGTEDFDPAFATQALTVNRRSQSISFAELNAVEFGNSVTLTATASSELAVMYTSSDETIVKIADNQLQVLKVGSVTITASQGGTEDEWMPAEDVSQTLVINKGSQNITFSIPDKTIGDAAFQLQATVNSGLPISYVSTSNKIELDGDQLILVKEGRVTIAALVDGNDNYNGASKEINFCIRPVKPTISVDGLGSDSPVLTSSAASGNQWYLNEELIDGATNSSFTVTQPGFYQVRSTVDDCSSIFSDEQVLIITGVEQENEKRVSVHPNPATENITITLGTGSGLKSITVYSMDGMKISADNTREDKLVMNVSSLSTGIYLVQVETETGRKAVRFVKK